MLTVDSWIGTGNEESALALARDDTYIYAAIAYDADTDSSVIMKIDPSDMSEVARWDYEDFVEIMKMVVSGGYLFVATPNGILKIDTSDMTLNDSLDYPADTPGITLCGGYLFALVYDSLIKIDPSTMDMVDYLYPFSGYYSLTNDGTYVYAGAEEGAEVVKVDPATSPMSIVDTWDGSGDWEYVLDIDYGDGYVFAAVANETSEQTAVEKIHISDMNSVGTFDIPDDDWAAVVLYDNSAVYIGIWWWMGPPSRVYKIDPATMTLADAWTGATETEGAMGLAFLNDYSYVGLYTSPAEVDKVGEGGFILTINIVGRGSVDKNPDQGAYPPDTEVTLEAIPDDGWAFSEWGGDLTGSENPKTIIMDGDKTVTTTFVPLYQYILTVNIMGSGSVIKDPDKVTYDPGDYVQLTAVPSDSWFKEWTGDLTGSENPSSIYMDGNKTVTAVFSKDHFVDDYTAPSGQYLAQCLAADEAYVYTALGSTAPWIKKIAKETMGLAGNIGPLSDLTAPYCMTADGTYVFWGHKYHYSQYPFDNARVLKIGVSPFQGIQSWWGGSNGEKYDPGANSLAHDAAYVYFGVTWGAKSAVVKIQKSNMSDVATWVPSETESDLGWPGPALFHDGDYLYAGLMYADEPFTGRVYKIDPATMSNLGYWSGYNQHHPYAVTGDGIYIYIALYSSPATVVKVDRVTMSTAAIWIGPSEYEYQTHPYGGAICMNDGRLFFSPPISPAWVIEINPETMTTVQAWQGESGYGMVNGLTTDFIYAALATNPGKIVKLFFPLSPGAGRRSFAGVIG